VMRSLARKDWAGAAALLEAGSGADEGWSAARLEAAMAPFFAEHASLRIDPKARAPENTRIEPTEDGTWKVEQILLDPEEANDWALAFTIDLARSREEARPVLALTRVTAP
jgi:hypothetical protein